MNTFRFLTDPRHACALFVGTLLAVYAVTPLAVNAWIAPNEYFVELAGLTTVAALAMVIGNQLPLFDRRFLPDAARIGIPATAFHVSVWTAFIIFAIITIATAPSVPLLSALSGATMEDLDQQRGSFLKSRTGVEAILIYLSTLFTSALLPYSLAHLYITKAAARHFLALIFLSFAVVFLVKALFITVAAPLIYVLARQQQASTAAHPFAIVLGGAALLYMLTKLAFGGEHAIEPPDSGFTDFEHYFTSKYQALGTVNFIVWRTLSVPLFTAADTLAVFEDEFSREHLFGATSSMVAALLGVMPVPLEQLVYAHQFGWNDTANANAVYITDMFVNFGWAGLIITSLGIGQALRWFRLSTDEALRAQWLLFCYMLFTGSIFGVMLSNGFSLILLLVLTTVLRTPPPPVKI